MCNSSLTPACMLQEYPEYYQVIKRPIDMQRIQQRILSKQYEQLDDMVNDFLLMFDNACKFNEPDSLIYKVKEFKKDGKYV